MNEPAQPSAISPCQAGAAWYSSRPCMRSPGTHAPAGDSPPRQRSAHGYTQPSAGRWVGVNDEGVLLGAEWLGEAVEESKSGGGRSASRHYIWINISKFFLNQIKNILYKNFRNKTIARANESRTQSKPLKLKIESAFFWQQDPCLNTCPSLELKFDTTTHRVGFAVI